MTLKRIAAVLLAGMLLISLHTVRTAEAAGSKVDPGSWHLSWFYGNYGVGQVDLTLSNARSNKMTATLSSDSFTPLQDSRENYDKGIGKMRSSLVKGQIAFNAQGVGVLTYKDEYNQGKLTIKMGAASATVTWAGKSISDYSFPNGTFILYKNAQLSASEMNKIGIFLSNFTELHLDRFDSKRYSGKDLIRFGIWHNYINAYDTKISHTKDHKLYIGKTDVEQTIKKYFNISFTKHASITGFSYNGKGYLFDGADGGQIEYVKAQQVSDMGNHLYAVTGQLYNPDGDATQLSGRVEATIQKITTGGSSRYVLIKLTVK